MLSIYQGKERVYIDGGVSFEFSNYNNIKYCCRRRKSGYFFLINMEIVALSFVTALCITALHRINE